MKTNTPSAFLDFYQLLNLDQQLRENTLNLNASENHMSHLARQVLSQHPSYDCYEFPPSGGTITGPWQFQGPPINEQLVNAIASMCATLFGSSRVDVRPKGGQSAEIAILLGLAAAGDSVFSVSELQGGHFGLTTIADKCGIQLLPIPFDNVSQQIDLESLLIKMRQVWQPKSNKLMIVNQSFILQHQNWSLIVNTLKQHFDDLIISCDASHLLGLIAGHQLANPLQCGVDILHASTHKTFPGPQKALIMFHKDFDNQQEARVRQIISPALQSNCGTAEIIALGICCAEMLAFAKPYSKAVCNHATELARSLVKQDIDVIGAEFNYTQTHQCWIPIGDELKAWQLYNRLHTAGLRGLPSWLPFVETWGIRLGTNALTRRGLTTQQFHLIAKWIAELLTAKQSTVAIKQQVTALASQFPLTKLAYSFDFQTVNQGSQSVSTV